MFCMIGVSYGCDEPNPNCGASTAAYVNIQCGGQDVQISNVNCSQACSYLWFNSVVCTPDVVSSTACNLFGCNCVNCALNLQTTIRTDFEPPSYPYQRGCTMLCNCNCATGPVKNAGQSNSVDAINYLNSTVVGRRRIVSDKYCLSGQVSLDFLMHLEEIADVNKDGKLTVEEFDAARDASKVTVSLGCDSPRIEERFPNIVCGSRLRHAKRNY